MKRAILAIALAIVAVRMTAETFGHWYWTEVGLPAYEYTGRVPYETTDDRGGDSQLPEDPYFLLGNHRLTLFAHVSGTLQMMTAERVWARINAAERPNYGVNSATLTVGKKPYELVGLQSLAADPAQCQRRFGVGFADYQYAMGQGISCQRHITVSPSETVGGGEGAFTITVSISNSGRTRQRITYREQMPIRFVPMGLQMMAESDRPVAYPTEATPQTGRHRASIAIGAQPTRFLIWPKPNESSYYETLPPTVTMLSESAAVSNEGSALTATETFDLRPGQTKTITIKIGFGDISPSLPTAKGEASWQHILPDFSSEPDEVMRREMLWNAYVVEASAKYSQYFDETFVPQGSVYSYHYGDNIANRDHLQALLSAIYTRPELAKSALRYVLKQTLADGEMTRGNQGYGYAPPMVYKESDQQLYVAMAVADYLRVTGDYAFLREPACFYPVETNHPTTVEEILKRQFVYLRDEIGRGPNGLIRLQNSDWSDSFLHKYSPNVFHWSAESHLNSAMAMAVLPGYVEQLRGHASDDFVDAVAQYADEVTEAYLRDLGDRPYSARAYLDADHRFGLDLACIEPHSYLLQARQLPVERRRAIYRHIRPLLEQSEAIGIRTRERSMWGDPAAAEDGGIWFALEYPLLLGVATFDCAEAWRLMKKFSFDTFAREYPDYWVGHWTAADEVGSTFYRPGLYAYWIPIDNYRHGFEGYCNHPHTWPLYCYYRLKEMDKHSMKP